MQKALNGKSKFMSANLFISLLLLVIEYGDFIIITTNFNEGFLCYGIFSEFKFDIVCLCEHAKDTHTNANLDRAKIR